MVHVTNPEQVPAMRAMVAKYVNAFPTSSPEAPRAASTSSPAGDVLLITGTTGSLGCHLLESTAANANVRLVYALNREARDKTPLYKRQRSALVDRGIDSSILDSGKIVLLEGDLTKPQWGLSDDQFNELRQSITHIIHNAWRVDLVAPFSAFESNVYGLRCLVDFCLASPLPRKPRLIFESSVGVLRDAPCDRLILEEPIPVEWATSTGYASSKWVCEQIVLTAVKESQLDGLVVRVGQLTGGKGGAWATNEWFPALVQSAPSLGCFPDDPRGVDWMAFEAAADALVDFCHAPQTITIVHLLHPRPTTFHALAEAVSAQLGVPLVPFVDWLPKLIAAQRVIAQIPDAAARRAATRKLRGTQLVGFFQSQVANFEGIRALGWPWIDSALAVKASPTLANPELRQLGAEDVARWLAYWRRVGFLLDAAPTARL